MALGVFPVTRFGGLNLSSDPEEVQHVGALNLLNVTLTPEGRLATRAGYSAFKTSQGGFSIVQSSSTGDVLVGDYSTAVTAYNSAGTQLATDSAGKGASGFALLGTTSSTLTYMASPLNTTLRSWNGTAFANVAGSPAAERVAVTPWDNRVVATRSASHKVWFSDAGDGATWGANNFVGVTPGDGEVIAACVAWRDLLFVFKQTKFFVFYNTSTSSSGTPIFNYRTVWGTGAVSTTSYTHVVAAGRDGVYFVSADGVYVTTGGPPRRVSGALDGWFRGESLPYATSTSALTDLNDAVLGVVGDRVYFCPDYAVALTFVYDVVHDAWSVYDWKLSACCPYGVGSVPPQPLVIINNANVYKHLTTSTTDAGTAISWKYRTGFMDLGVPGAEKVVREWRVDGQGSVTVKTAVNDASTLGSGSTLTLGTAPATDQGWDRRAVRGRNVSVELSGSGAAQVSRLEAHISAQRAPGLSAG